MPFHPLSEMQRVEIFTLEKIILLLFHLEYLINFSKIKEQLLFLNFDLITVVIWRLNHPFEYSLLASIKQNKTKQTNHNTNTQLYLHTLLFLVHKPLLVLKHLWHHNYSKEVKSIQFHHWYFA